MGGFAGTLLLSVILAPILANNEWMTCPRKVGGGLGWRLMPYPCKLGGWLGSLDLATREGGVGGWGATPDPQTRFATCQPCWLAGGHTNEHGQLGIPEKKNEVIFEASPHTSIEWGRKI